MTHHDRHRLLFGRYKTPIFDYGDVVFCEIRGDVTIRGLTNARILWPLGKKQGLKSRFIILYGDLAEAVRKESAQAIAYWWRVGADTAWRWRKALEVPAKSEGTLRLMSEYARDPAFDAVREKAVAKAGDPQLRAKIAAARRG